MNSPIFFVLALLSVPTAFGATGDESSVKSSPSTLSSSHTKASVKAVAGVGAGGGGDVCQERIESIQSDISDWIQSNGSVGLDLSKTQFTLSDYNTKMQNIIALTRKDDQASISCTDDQSLVKFDGVEKTCIAYSQSPNQPRILCYRGKSNQGQFENGFMGLSQDDQYFQVHHEFAVLAGMEDQAGQSSDYPLSEQITGYLETQEVRKLAVKVAHQPLQPAISVECSLDASASSKNVTSLVRFQAEIYDGKAVGVIEISDYSANPSLLSFPDRFGNTTVPQFVKQDANSAEFEVDFITHDAEYFTITLDTKALTATVVDDSHPDGGSVGEKSFGAYSCNRM